MGSREFANEFSEYSEERILDSNGQYANKSFQRKLVDKIQHHTSHLVHSLPDLDDRDYSVYTGTTGISLLFAKLEGCQAVMMPDFEFLPMAISMIKRPLHHLKGSKSTFLCGDAGPLALGAVWYAKVGENKDKEKCIKRLLAMVPEVCSKKGIADEHLTGRAGFLYALLFVRHHLGDDIMKLDPIRKVFMAIIESGRAMSHAQRWQCPLLYEWHDSKYLGAAHGLSGIFYTLMQAASVDPSLKPTIVEYVVPSMDYLMSLKFPSGNYPSSVGSSGGDKLIHWCHGAPGWIYMFVQAYKLLADSRYLEAARSCAHVIWRRGLLRKGYGLCHGVAGNGYAFLLMYRLTSEEKYLYRAVKFAEWCFDYGKHGCRTPDRPMSLYEGLAGTIYFWVDLLEPTKAKFPGFEL